MKDVDIARIAHAVNRAYCQHIGDDSQPEFDAAPEWQTVSAVSGVAALRKKPNSTPAESHESWLASKRADGWVYGPVKDPEKKQHPCMVPYSELPAEQQLKDHLFCAVVRAALKADVNPPNSPTEGP